MAAVLSCPHFPPCSGCSAIGVPYGEQVQAKLTAVRGVFHDAGLPGFNAEGLTSITRSPDAAGYRNRAKLVPAPGGTLGIYREGSHEVVDIPGCPVHRGGINQVVEAVRSGIRALDIPLYDERHHTGELRFVTVREGVRTGQTLVGFVTRTGAAPYIDELAQRVSAQCATCVGIVHNINGGRGNVIFGPTSRVLTGQPYVEEVVCNTRLRLGLTSFFQVNTPVAERAYEAIAAALALTSADTLIDLYCGVGGIGLTAAGHAGRVIGVESAREAVDHAKAAARLNRIPNAEFICEPVESYLAGLAPRLHRRGVPAQHLAVALNPPRKGLDEGVVDAVAGLGPRKIAYLSCSPQSLIRDLARFARRGYHVDHVELFDMFPQTDQVETLAVLSPAPDAADPPLRRGRQAIS